MQEIDLDAGVSHALDALVNDRLAILLGAGLSMAPPSSLPSAAELAATAKRKYDALYGTTRPPLAEGIEEQAEFFFQRDELATVYFRTLIDFNAFAGKPNPGHEAVADLLLTGAIQTAVTTNVDILVETAGQSLFGHIATGVSGTAVAALPPDKSPLLKIHGCRTLDPDNMVLAPGQLNAEPVSGYITSSAQWLGVRLLDRDLIIVGYWTDWDYLNAVLEQALGTVRPARVIVVDPADEATFEAKAPVLYRLGVSANPSFYHVRGSGADFLAVLRSAFSKSFVRRILHSGSQDFSDLTGANPDSGIMEPPDLENEVLWRVRRDLEGRCPNEPAADRTPPDEPLLGLTLLQLRAAGAVPDGAYWLLKGRRVRVLRASNQPLHRVKAAFERELAPAIAPDVIIAVGAEAQTLPSNIVRGRTTATITRGSSSQWFTRAEAIQEFGL